MESFEGQEGSADKSRPKLTTTGKVLLGISGGAFVTVFAVTTPFIWPALRKICLPYVPATTEQVQNVMKLLTRRHGTGRMIDLGSGDGRIVIEAAKGGYQATGVELNPWLVWYSRWQAWRQGLHGKTRFYRMDMFKHDFLQYENVVVFGVPSLMEPLEVKLSKELPPEGRVIACRFPLPNWTPIHTIDAGIDTVWLYKSPENEDIMSTVI